MQSLISSSQTLNTSVFNLKVDAISLSIASNDKVTAVAASGGLLWVGTESGRLIRHDTLHTTTEEVRGRLGVGGRLDNAVWRIYADPHTHAALIILHNFDMYYAQGTGAVRPRWLAKIRGLRCVSATWLRVPDSKGDRNVALLGTAFGALFSLTIDGKYEKEDSLTSLWTAPNHECVDGIRVEYVAGKYVGTVATTPALYLFSDAMSLNDLFVESRMTVVKRSDEVADANAQQPAATNASAAAPDGSQILPSELQFMTGNSGVASRRFVWAAAPGVTHAQLAVRRRRSEKPPRDATDAAADATASSRASFSTVIASVVEKETLSWARLKETSGSAVPLACNLSAFHVLILYPDSVYAFNQISGQLTQRVTLWSHGVSAAMSGDPTATTVSETPRADWPLSMSRSLLASPAATDGSHRMPFGREAKPESKRFLSKPAAGFARDVLTDTLWVYTSDGEFGRLSASNAEQTEAWKAAKAIGRFDLAMALAPLVSGGTADDATMFRTREAVLEAQADHAATEGNWDMAAQLYAKTDRPIEAVVLSIVEACWNDDVDSGKTAGMGADDGKNSNRGSSRNSSRNSSKSSSNLFAGGVAYSGKSSGKGGGGVAGAVDLSSLRTLGIGARLQTTRHIITYLVRKLDRIDEAKATQRTIIATLLVQLYASQLSCETDETERDAMRKDFGHFLADRHKDVDVATSLTILQRNDCGDEAWKLALLSGDVLAATEVCVRGADVDQAVELLRQAGVQNDADTRMVVVAAVSNVVSAAAPRRVAAALARAVRRDAGQREHLAVLHGLCRVARAARHAGVAARPPRDGSVPREAYAAAVDYAYNVLLEWRTSGMIFSRWADWTRLVTVLFALIGELGTEAEAQRCYDNLVAPVVAGPAGGSEPRREVVDALGAIVRAARIAGFRRLAVFVYQALQLPETAVRLAVDLDLALAEARAADMSGHGSVSGGSFGGTTAGVGAGGSSLSGDAARGRALWRAVATASPDAVGVAARSHGVLRVEDVLPDMESFDTASDRVRAAVTESLREHRRQANDAKSDAVAALQVVAALRGDLATARDWRASARVGGGPRGALLPCGHSARRAVAASGSGARQCALCGDRAIDAVASAFDGGIELRLDVPPMTLSSTTWDGHVKLGG